MNKVIKKVEQQQNDAETFAYAKMQAQNKMLETKKLSQGSTILEPEATKQNYHMQEQEPSIFDATNHDNLGERVDELGPRDDTQNIESLLNHDSEISQIEQSRVRENHREQSKKAEISSQMNFQALNASKLKSKEYIFEENDSNSFVMRDSSHCESNSYFKRSTNSIIQDKA